MSSISATERSRQTEEARTNREDYNDRETELVKKQKKEVKRLTEMHDKEVQSIKDEYTKQIDELRSRNKESLTAKDEKHQKSIDQIRNLHSEQLRRKLGENRDIQENFKQTYEDKIKKEKDISEQQKTSLKRNFDESLADRDRSFKSFSEQATENVKQSIGERTEKLNQKHKVEMNEVIEDRDAKVAHARQVQEEMRNNYTGRLKDQDRDHQSQLSKVNSNWEENLRREQFIAAEGSKGKDEIYQQSRRHMQDEFRQKTDSKVAEIQNGNDSFKDQVNERIENQVKSAQNKVERMKVENSQAVVANRRIRDLERRDIIHQYEDRMSLVEKEKRDIFDEAKQDREQKISEVIDRQNKIMQNTNQGHRQDMNLINTRNREDRGMLVTNNQNQVEHVKDRAGLQVKRILEATNKNTIAQEKVHRESIDQAKADYQDSLAAQRDSQTGNLEKSTSIMEGRLRDLELRHQNKLDGVKSFYDTKIEKMQDEHKKELAKLDELNQQKAKQSEKAHKLDLESQGQRLESKVGQMEEMHQKELERQEKRHQEQMNSLARQVSYYKKNN